MEPQEPQEPHGPAAQDRPSGRGRRIAKKLGWKRTSMVLLALAVLLPVLLITLGVVAVPVLAVPAVIVFFAGVLIWAIGRSRQEPLPDEEEG
ncbi:MAG: hypothetical protein ACODAU_11490 [Myxococcota bacterium]